MDSQEIADSEIASTADLIKKLQPIAKLAKLKRDISVYRLEAMSADLQMHRLRNPKTDSNENDREPKQGPSK